MRATWSPDNSSVPTRPPLYTRRKSGPVVAGAAANHSVNACAAEPRNGSSRRTPSVLVLVAPRAYSQVSASSGRTSPICSPTTSERRRPPPLQASRRRARSRRPRTPSVQVASIASRGSRTAAVFLRTLTPWRDCALRASRSSVFTAALSVGLGQLFRSCHLASTARRWRTVL